jgi:AcrR family transcriptional regulator
MMPGMATESSPGRRARVTSAVLTVTDECGLDRATVREVAARAGVSIGTVQHYFPTKDAMLVAAFEEVVRRIRARIEAIALSAHTRENLVAVLQELLPLDDERATEVRVQLAFNARAMTDPDLAAVQRSILGELHQGIADAVASLPGTTEAEAATAAHVLVAAADGLALHAVTSDGWFPAAEQKRALTHAVASLVPASGQGVPPDPGVGASGRGTRPARRRAADAGLAGGAAKTPVR